MDNELYHYGVLGMKWGVRKKKMFSGNSKKDTSPKSIREMSDDELRTKISRLQLEKQYIDLYNYVNPKTVKKGKSFISNIIKRSGENVLGQLTTYTMAEGVNALAKKMGVKNAKTPVYDANGNQLIDKDGLKVFVDTFENIVNPRKGQKDK